MTDKKSVTFAPMNTVHKAPPYEPQKTGWRGDIIPAPQPVETISKISLSVPKTEPIKLSIIAPKTETPPMKYDPSPEPWKPVLPRETLQIPNTSNGHNNEDDVVVIVTHRRHAEKMAQIINNYETNLNRSRGNYELRRKNPAKTQRQRTDKVDFKVPVIIPYLKCKGEIHPDFWNAIAKWYLK